MGNGASAYPYVKTEWIKPGALFCLPGAANFDESLLLDEKTKLVVDNIKLYEAWAEEYPYPTFDMIYILGSKFMDLAHEASWINQNPRPWCGPERQSAGQRER